MSGEDCLGPPPPPRALKKIQFEFQRPGARPARVIVLSFTRFEGHLKRFETR